MRVGDIHVSEVEASRVGGIVLCGGKSSRMGRPKLSLPFGRESMLQRVVRIVQEVVSPVVVVAAPGQSLPKLAYDVIIARDEKEGLGPLGGLSVGLSVLQPRVDAAYASSCDVPLLLPAFVRRMAALLGEHDVAIPFDGQYHHPLAAVYRTRLADDASALVAEQRLRPVFLLDRCECRLVDVQELRSVDPELCSLRNINTQQAYDEALAAAGLSAGKGTP